VRNTGLAPANINTHIPSALKDLASFAASHSCSDGPDAITRLRNFVSHPRRRNGTLGLPIDTWFQAWQLSMNYLQLLILKRFGYEGSYLDRLLSRTDSHARPVPWTV